MTRIARAAIAAALLAGGCKVNTPTATVVKDPVIATIGQVPVYRSEFSTCTTKNPPAADSVSKDKSVREYLDLYLNFRLKVLDAESLGSTRWQPSARSLSGYKEQLAEPYLMDSTVTAGLVREAYEHMKERFTPRTCSSACPRKPTPKIP
jgi:peptidyl-prolyl cis-trans isomerase SurA